ncbi:hypothetical protein ACFL2B_02145 [Patescibacteria group bacterium]
MKKPTVKQLEYFFRQIEQGRINRKNLQDFLERADGMESFNITIPNEPHAELHAKLIELGNYDWVSEDITVANFPPDESQFGDFELIMVHLNVEATTEEVLADLKERNLEPAKIGHLLAFGAKYPEIQREFSIAALGSSWVCPYGHRRVPCLGGGDAERRLRLGWRDDLWYVSWRFLALRKLALGNLDS